MVSYQLHGNGNTQKLNLLKIEELNWLQVQTGD